MRIRSAHPAITFVVFGVFLTASILVRQQMKAQVGNGVSCSDICSGVPGEEYQICMDACSSSFGGPGDAGENIPTGFESFDDPMPTENFGQQSTSATSQEFNFGDEPPSILPDWFQSANPSSQAASKQSSSFAIVVEPKPIAESCTIVTFRKQETGFCILANSCSVGTILRGFVRDATCRNALDLTHLYTAPGEHPAAPLENATREFSVGDAAAEAILLVDPLLNRIPEALSLAGSMREFRSYLSVLRSNASMRVLTPLETEATTQYLRLRLIYIADMLKAAGISVDEQVQTNASKRQAVEDGLRTILYSLLPRTFEKIAAANIPGFDLTNARGSHGNAAEQFEVAKESCFRDRMSDTCRLNLQKVLDTLTALKALLKPRLESLPLWGEIESTLTLEQTDHAAPSEEGFPRPVLQ